MGNTYRRRLRSELLLVFVVAFVVSLSGCSHRADFPMHVENQTDEPVAVFVTIMGNVTGHVYYRFTSNVSRGGIERDAAGRF